MTREETSKYSEPLPDGRIRQFSFEVEANSVITSPAYPEKIEPGWLEIRGLAWSGSGKIAKAEVSTDAGQNWSAAELQGACVGKVPYTVPLSLELAGKTCGNYEPRHGPDRLHPAYP